VKRIAFVLVALLTVFALIGGASAAEKKAAQPKMAKASGAVLAYEEGKTIKVQGPKEEWTFALAPEAKIKGAVKGGAYVTVMYQKQEGKMIASSVTVAAEQKTKKKKT